MSEPIEGAHYRNSDGDEFAVVLTGLWHGTPGFIINIEGQLAGHQLSWWKGIYGSPEPAFISEADPSLLCGCSISPNVQVQAHRDADGNLSLIEIQDPRSAD